jgi:hypothetical protein|tara:strand:+ start:1085 stop:1447 length:363 start_codon:yes stop_codon:yes gene_type:complete
MTIKIDREMFKGRVYSKFSRRINGSIATGELAEAVYDLAQKWIDREEWKTNLELDTSRECRIEMMRFIRGKIDFEDANKAWGIASKNWRFIATNVIVYIVGLILDHYWEDVYRDIRSRTH